METRNKPNISCDNKPVMETRNKPNISCDNKPNKGGKCVKKSFSSSKVIVENKDVKTQCERKETKSIDSENPKRGRKRVADTKCDSSVPFIRHKRSATNLPKASVTNLDFLCKTTLTSPLSTGGKLSKLRALQRIQEETQNQNVKCGLFEKTSAHTIQVKKSRETGKRKCNSKSENDEDNQQELLKNTWQDILLPSEDSLLLTPDPICLEKRVLSDVSEPSSNYNSLSFDPNLSKDTCSSDSEEDLPEGLTPVKHDGQFSRGDIVWARVRGWPFWPGIVTNVYKKKKKIFKLSVRFLNDVGGTNTTKLTYPLRPADNRGQRHVYPFTDAKRKQFEEAGSKSLDKVLIDGAVTLVEDYLTKMGLGLVKSNALDYFFPNSQDLCEASSDESSIVEEAEPNIDGVKRLESVSSLESEEIFEPLTEDDVVESKTIRARNEKRRNRCENLVEFIKSAKMKNYLLKVYFGKRESLLHKSYYGTVSEKNKIRNPGFGPINDEEQRTEVLDKLVSWASEIPGFKAAYIDYVIDVWMPEAVVFALISVKGYARGRAWSLFRKGISFTKEELAASHKALLEAADRISPQDKIMYKEKLQDRIRRALAV